MNDSLQAAERIVLGALMLDNSQLSRVDIGESDFRSMPHRQIFETIKALISVKSVCDALTVAEVLERQTGRNDWISFTAGMIRDCLAPVNAPSYAGVVRRASLSRQAIAIADRLKSEPTAEGIDTTIRELMELTREQKDFVCHQTEAMTQAMDALLAVADGSRLPGVPTGIRDIDESLGGMHKGDLIVVAARPAMGKTAYMLNTALAANVPVGIFSGEQGREQLGMRILAIKGPVSLHRMRTAKLYDDEWTRVNTVINASRDRQIWIYDKPGPTIDEIERQARAWKFHRDIGVVFVDYLQKIRGGEGENFRLQVGDICVRLKNLARELDVPVVALAQVKREVESRPMGQDGLGRMPYMSDISEAGIIEQESDQIITLYRPEVYDDSPQFRGLAYANICKNRHGPVGHKAIAWRGEYLQFGDLARTEMHQDRWSAA
jgi:replicative DNA helicase